MINTVSSVQLADSSTPLAKAVLQVDLYAFLLRCFGSDALVVDAGADLIVRLHDVGTLTNVLNREQVENLLLRAKKLDVLRPKFVTLKECLNARSFPNELSFSEEVVERAIDSIEGISGNSRWALAVASATQSARAMLQDVSYSRKLQEEARSSGEMHQQLRLIGKSTYAGRVPLSTLEGVLKGWHKLFEVAYGVIRQKFETGRQNRAAAPNIFRLGTSNGIVRNTPRCSTTRLVTKP